MTATAVLIHTEENYMLEVEGMTQADIIARLNEDGYKMGRTSLQNLMSGKAEVSCGFTYQFGMAANDAAKAVMAEGEALLEKLDKAVSVAGQLEDNIRENGKLLAQAQANGLIPNFDHPDNLADGFKLDNFGPRGLTPEQQAEWDAQNTNVITSTVIIETPAGIGFVNIPARRPLSVIGSRNQREGAYCGCYALYDDNLKRVWPLAHGRTGNNQDFMSLKEESAWKKRHGLENFFNKNLSEGRGRRKAKSFYRSKAERAAEYL